MKKETKSKTLTQKKNEEDEERWGLTEWGCLYSVLKDYSFGGSFKIDAIPGAVGRHIVEDFLNLMCKCGYIAQSDTESEAVK